MKFLVLTGLMAQFAVFPVNTKTLLTKISVRGSSPLTERKWEMQEIRFLYNNTEYYYSKTNHSATNINFDHDHIVFNCDGSGTYQQADNTNYALQWHYKTNKENAIEFTISKFRNNSDLLVNWEDMEFSLNTIKYTEYYTHQNGLPTLGRGIRISKEPADRAGKIMITNATFQ
jgi:hypothetical protein